MSNFKVGDKVKPHKHADVIRAYADGAEIEFRSFHGDRWSSTNNPSFFDDYEYRVKPVKKPDLVRYGKVQDSEPVMLTFTQFPSDNLKLTFCGNTGKLLSAEVIKEET